MKICSKCQQEKELTEFFKDKGFKSGYMSMCKVCKTANALEWRAKNRSKYNATQRDYNAEHYQRLRLQRYKITPEQHAQMLLDQKGVCAICEQLPKGKRPLVVDHHHATGKVRGLLCYGCNRAISILDKHDLLQKALAYLEKSK